MTIAFISDLHLTPQRPSIMREFSDFMSQSGKLLDEIYILGDLFEYWIGDDAYKTLGYDSSEEVIRKTVEENTKVYFIAGNRDFLIGEEFAKRTGAKIIKDGTVLNLDGTTVLLSHGDHLCTDDTEHMAAREQLLSPEWQKNFLAQPIQGRIETADALRAQSEASKKVKSAEIMDVNTQAVVNFMSQHDANILIHGHTHRPYVHSLEVNGEKVRRYVLGDWDTSRSVLYYNQGKFYLKK